MLVCRLYSLVSNLVAMCFQAELDKAIDFLDPIDGDVPKGGQTYCMYIVQYIVPMEVREGEGVATVCVR